MSTNVLQVSNLQTHFRSNGKWVKAVEGVSWALAPGQTLALVGESGCGKSVTALSILRLVPDPPGRIVGGAIRLSLRGESRDLLTVSQADMRRVRGKDIAMIFQEPMTSLNPVYTVGRQIIEAVELHTEKRGQAARDHAAQMLHLVGIPSPASRLDDYPHQMSGGMRQRVMIAMALSCNPAVLIADEPTTALDVTIQAQILDLLRRLQRELGMSILMITHDLGVVAEIAHEVAVMYAGHIVETAPTEELFAQPRHPYTVGLLKSIPRLGEAKKRLAVIPGNVPDPAHFPTGCKFHPRCWLGREDAQCQTQDPPLEEISPGHCVRCWKWREVAK